jgi:hypothetical protein
MNSEQTFSTLAISITQQIDRLGWNNWQRQQWFKEEYGVFSPWILENDALQDALFKLQDLADIGCIK